MANPLLLQIAAGKSQQTASAHGVSTPALLCLSILLALTPAPSTATAGDEVRIGVLLTMTGPFAEIGEDCRRGIEAARNYYGQSEPDLVKRVVPAFGDSQSDPKVAIKEFSRLVDVEQVLAVVTMRSSIGMPLNPIAKSRRVALLGAVGHQDFASQSDYAFQYWPLASDEGGVLARTMLSRGLRRVATLTAEDEWNLSLSDEFRKAFLAGGGNIVASETAAPTELDFAAVIERLRARRPDALFVNLGLHPGAVAIRLLRERGIKLPVYSNFWSGDASAISAEGREAAEGISFPEVQLGFSQFVDSVRDVAAVTPKRPSAMTLTCFAMYSSVLDVFRRNPEVSTADEFYGALSSADTVPFPDGSFPIANRRVILPVVMKTIRQGEVVEIQGGRRELAGGDAASAELLR